MKRIHIKSSLARLLFALPLTGISSFSAHAQYPDIPAEIKAQTDQFMKEGYRRSDSAWLKALPVI
ncbi:polysaccharide lyase, partial [Pararcticibacter amylolyticus]